MSGVNYRSKVLGSGHYLPSRVVTNADLEPLLDTTDSWIQERTGILERRFIEQGETGAGMGTSAARKALEMAGLTAQDLDMIVVGTLSPDIMFPGNAVFVGAELGIPGVPCLDIRQQCTGFIYGISLADQYIRSGTCRNVLVIGSEIHSTGLEMAPRGRDVSVLFGDGAGAVVLGRAADGDPGIMGIYLHADGRYADDLTTVGPGSRNHPRIVPEELTDGSIYPKMNGQKVFKFACRYMVAAVNEAAKGAGIQIADIDFFIFHQANIRIIQFVQKALRIPDQKTHVNIQRYGNTTAASIPIALDEAARQGKLKPGDTLCLAAFGAGFTWGSALMGWSPGDHMGDRS